MGFWHWCGEEKVRAAGNIEGQHPRGNRRVSQPAPARRGVSLLRPGIRATCPACPGLPWGVPWTDPNMGTPLSPLSYRAADCLRQLKVGMNMGKRCLQSRPRGPAPKISPARKGWVHKQAVERRRCGTTLFVCSLGAREGLAVSLNPRSNALAAKKD
jgi:hypothetical protein